MNFSVPAGTDTTYLDSNVVVDSRLGISKSGGTVETLSHFAYFFERVRDSRQFVAITDPGTTLEALARMKADLQSLVTRLEHQLALVEGRMEESQARLDKIAQRTEQIDSKEFVIKGNFGAGAPDSNGNATAPRIVVKEKTEVDKLYQMAYQDFQARKYDMAREGFEDLVRNHPQSDLADNAQYWVAECYYAKKDFRKSIEEYTKVLKNYPNANKASSAMYKLGLALERVNDATGRDKVWEELLKKYPASEEAALVKSKLADTAGND